MLYFFAHTRNAPRGDYLDVWVEAVECQLETDLVVALARATVRHILTLHLGRRLNHATGNDWAGQRRAEQVDILTLVTSSQQQTS